MGHLFSRPKTYDEKMQEAQYLAVRDIDRFVGYRLASADMVVIDFAVACYVNTGAHAICLPEKLQKSKYTNAEQQRMMATIKKYAEGVQLFAFGRVISHTKYLSLQEEKKRAMELHPSEAPPSIDVNEERQQLLTPSTVAQEGAACRQSMSTLKKEEPAESETTASKQETRKQRKNKSD